jgi:hypothetical protein
MSETLHLRHQVTAGVVPAEDLEAGTVAWADAVVGPFAPSGWLQLRWPLPTS